MLSSLYRCFKGLQEKRTQRMDIRCPFSDTIRRRRHRDSATDLFVKPMLCHCGTLRTKILPHQKDFFFKYQRTEIMDAMVLHLNNTTFFFCLTYLCLIVVGLVNSFMLYLWLPIQGHCNNFGLVCVNHLSVTIHFRT